MAMDVPPRDSRRQRYPILQAVREVEIDKNYDEHGEAADEDIDEEMENEDAGEPLSGDPRVSMMKDKPLSGESSQACS